jgi:glycerol uptake facilitator-like aquaporin
VNPARDLGPRMLTAMVGYGKEVFTYRKYVPVGLSADTLLVIDVFASATTGYGVPS